MKITFKKFVLYITWIPAVLAMGLIRIYQFLFSYDHSFWARYVTYRVCIYHPSCSEYTYQSIQRFGLIKGTWQGWWRIYRCAPGYPGGDDPVPETFSWRKGSNE